MSAPIPEPVPRNPLPAVRDMRTALHGFGPAGLLALVVILAAGALSPLIGAIAVIAWVVASRTPWRAIGYVRPRSWLLTLAGGIALGIAFKLMMKTLVMPMLGAPPVNAAFHFLVHNPRAVPDMIVASLIAGFAEETFYRGWMFERLGRLLGSGTAARVAIVAVTSLLFGLAHIPGQGLPGAEQAALTGAVFGILYTTTRTLPLMMIAHAAFDLTAVAIIFNGWEERLAHLIVR